MSCDSSWFWLLAHGSLWLFGWDEGRSGFPCSTQAPGSISYHQTKGFLQKLLGPPPVFQKGHATPILSPVDYGIF